MPDPNLRQLLEYARPVRDFAQTLQTALRLVEASVEAEAALASATARSQAALQRAQELEMKASQVEADVAAQREILLAPAREEAAKLDVERRKVRDEILRERALLDEERGRRTSILRALDEQVESAKRRAEESMLALRRSTKTEQDRLGDELERLRIQIEEQKVGLERIRADYRGIQQAAAKLVGR